MFGIAGSDRDLGTFTFCHCFGVYKPLSTNVVCASSGFSLLSINGEDTTRFLLRFLPLGVLSFGFPLGGIYIVVYPTESSLG